MFCLRLAAGLIWMLPIVSFAPIPPRFFRVHYLTGVGLLTVAGVFVAEHATMFFWIAFAASVVACALGSIVWHLDDAPGGKGINFLAPVALAACLILAGAVAEGRTSTMNVVDDVLSALVLGSATTAMLMGHSYLIAPSMTIVPLLQLLAAVGISVILRIGLACVGLWGWTSGSSAGTLETELLVWLPVRWVLGLIAPLVLGWMAWETARIRSTQSATGILYVVVIVCFLGELTSMLLLEKTGFVL